MSTLTEIAEAVKTQLNSITWSPTFTATRMNIPRHSRDSLSTLQVTVTPKSRTVTQVTRGKVFENVEIYIGIEKGLDGDTNTESDALIDLGEDIARYFENGRSLTTFAGAPCVGVTFGNGDGSPWMSVKDQNETLVYTGVIVLEFQALRAAN